MAKKKKSLKKDPIRNSDEMNSVSDEHKPVEADTNCERLVTSSVYAQPPVQLQFGENETTFYVPAHLTQGFPHQGRLLDVDVCSGHALVHWLYHQGYATLPLGDSDTESSDASELEKALRIYIMARSYNLEGLSKLAQGQIEKYGASVVMLDALEMSRGYFHTLEADTWYRAYLAELVESTFEQDHTLFRSGVFLEVLGTEALHKFLANFALTLLSQRLEAAEQAISLGMKLAIEATAPAKEVLSEAAQLCELDYPSIDGATTDLTEDGVMVHEPSPPCVVESVLEDDPWSFTSFAPSSAKKKKKKSKYVEEIQTVSQQVEPIAEPEIQLTSVVDPLPVPVPVQEPEVVTLDDPWGSGRTSIKKMKKKKGIIFDDVPPPPPKPEPIMEPEPEPIPDHEHETVTIPEPIVEDFPCEYAVTSIRKKTKKSKKSIYVEETPPPPPEPEEVCEVVPEPAPELVVEAVAQPATAEAESEPEPVPVTEFVQECDSWGFAVPSQPKKKKKLKKSRHVDEPPPPPPELEEVRATETITDPEPVVEDDPWAFNLESLKSKKKKKSSYANDSSLLPPEPEPIAEPVTESVPEPKSEVVSEEPTIDPFAGLSKAQRMKLAKKMKNEAMEEERAERERQEEAEAAVFEAEAAAAEAAAFEAEAADGTQISQPPSTLPFEHFICPSRTRHMFESSEWKTCLVCRVVVSQLAMELN